MRFITLLRNSDDDVHERFPLLKEQDNGDKMRFITSLSNSDDDVHEHFPLLEEQDNLCDSW